MGLKKYEYNGMIYKAPNKEFLVRRVFGTRDGGPIPYYKVKEQLFKKVPWDYSGPLPPAPSKRKLKRLRKLEREKKRGAKI